MNIFYLLIIVLTLSMQNVAKKSYIQKNQGGVYLFGGLTCFFAAIFFVVTSRGLEFERGIVTYAIAFATAYCITTIFSILAIGCGSLSLTNLMISYSLMIPTMYGVFFLKESLSLCFYPGIALLIVSLYMVNQTQDNQQVEKTQSPFKWILYVTLAALGNGMCTIVQKMQQVKLNGAYKNEFMVVALVSGAVGLIVLALFKERRELVMCVKKGWIYAMLGGMCNGILNLFVMILSGRMAASLMFPSISAGGIILTYIISKYFYKETLTKKQLIGFMLGIVSVILLNL